MAQLSNFVPMFTIAIKKRSVFVTQLGAALSFSDQIIFPSIDRENTRKAEGSFHRTSSSFQLVKSLSQRCGCAHPTGFWDALVTRIRLASFQQVDKSFYSDYGSPTLKTRSYSLYASRTHRGNSQRYPSSSNRHLLVVPSFLQSRAFSCGRSLKW